MITLLICAGIGLMLSLILLWRENEGIAEILFFVFVFTLLGLGVGILIAAGIGSSLPTEPVFDHETELVALKDSRGISGNFFLGCGNIGSNFYYVFYEKSPDGKIRFNRLLATDNVSLVEEDRENGVLQEYRMEFTKNSYKKWGLHNKSSRYEIHIPTESILTNFKLDLE